MGLETEFVLSEERHYGVFECLVCRNLVDLDALVTTACSHCFCRLCLHQWLERGMKGASSNSTREAVIPKCPTCNQDLLYSSNSVSVKYSTMMIGNQAVTVQPLQTCQPLAHRVLKRMHVRCTLRGVNCTWKGDYGDLQSHLLSQTAHNENSAGSGTAANWQQQQHNQSSHSPKDKNANESDHSHPMETDDTDELEASTSASATSIICRRITMAQSFKDQANDRFSTGHYREAHDLYGKALSNLIPVETTNSTKTAATTTVALDKESTALAAALYSNRAATHLAVKEYTLAVEDAVRAIQLDPGYTKAYVRQARALVQLGKFTDAMTALQNGHSNLLLVANANATAAQVVVLQKELSITTRLAQNMELGLQHLQDKEYAAAKSVFGNLLRETNSASVLLGAARADLGLGLTASTLRLTIQVLKLNPQSAEGYLVRGHCLCLMGELEAGVKLLKESMRLDPDSITTRTILKDCRKVQVLLQQGREKLFHRDFIGAVEQFGAAIDACPLLPPKSPLYGTLHTECAQAYLRLKKYDAALKECALVLYARDDDVHAWLIKFQGKYLNQQPVFNRRTQNLLSTHVFSPP
jgi:DnaJ family protein C protein 7